MSLLSDVRFAFRTLAKNPGFTAVVIVTLALGIGINAAVFTLMNTVLFKGFPLVEGNDRILYVSVGRGGVSYPDFEDWRAQAKSFEDLAVVADLPISLSDDGGFTESYNATRVSPNTFRLVGQRPIIGRDFSPSDATPGAAGVAILSYGFWERRFGKNPAIVGQAVRMNGAPTTVIGVMPQGFTFPERQDLWVPLTPTPDLQKREARDLWFAFGRMAAGVTIQRAAVEMETIGTRLEKAYARTNQGFRPVVQNFAGFFIGPNATMLYGAMWGAVGFVLLIACANIANLLLARAMARSREISVRIALGAGRWHIIRQLLIESLLLSAAGGCGGWWMAKLGVRAYELIANPPSYFDNVLDYRMDYRVFAYLVIISIATGFLFGLASALRLSKLDINAALKDGGRGSLSGARGGRRGRQLASLLVIGEMALAVVLLAGAGVMIRSFLNTYTADLGVKTTNVVTMLLKPPKSKYPSLEAQTSFFDRLITRLEAIPGVESIALADSLPTYSTSRVPYGLAGAPDVDELQRPKLSASVISPSYFRTLGATLLSGREFNATDRISSIPVVIVNQRFASKFWPGEDPLGKRLRLFDGKTPGAWLTVVGVVSNIVHYGRARPEFDALIYLPYRQEQAAFMNVIARTRARTGGLETAFRREVQALDSDLPVTYYMSLADRLSWVYASSRGIAILFLIFAAIALLLASIGLYAVIAHSVSQRTQEIGIRMAIGATDREIRKLVLLEGMLPLGIGLTIGLVASLAVNRVLKAALVQVSPADPIALAVASATLILAALLGCLIPARRAMRVDPAVALRHQ
jgi:putative ABC transport system permease protein